MVLGIEFLRVIRQDELGALYLEKQSGFLLANIHFFLTKVVHCWLDGSGQDIPRWTCIRAHDGPAVSDVERLIRRYHEKSIYAD